MYLWLARWLPAAVLCCWTLPSDTNVIRHDTACRAERMKPLCSMTGLSVLENQAVDARAVMHLIDPQREEVTWEQELCSVSCRLGFGNLFCTSCVAARGILTSCYKVLKSLYFLH